MVLTSQSYSITAELIYFSPFKYLSLSYIFCFFFCLFSTLRMFCFYSFFFFWFFSVSFSVSSIRPEKWTNNNKTQLQQQDIF